jgi:hypothetical protein
VWLPNKCLIYNTYDSQNLSEQFYSELNTKGINGDGYPSHGGIVNIGVSFAPDAPHDHSGKWLDIKYRFGPVTGTWESFDLDNGDPELEAGSFLPPQTGLGYSYNTLDWNDVVDSHIFSPVVGIFALFYNFLGAEFHIIRYKNHEPTFIPYNSALDIVNGQSKFDAVVVSEDKNYHDRFPEVMTCFPGKILLSGLLMSSIG